MYSTFFSKSNILGSGVWFVYFISKLNFCVLKVFCSDQYFGPFRTKILAWAKNFQYIKIYFWSKKHFLYSTFFSKTNILVPGEWFVYFQGKNSCFRARPTPILGHLDPKYWSEQKTFNTWKFTFDLRNIFCIQHFSLKPIFWSLVSDLSIFKAKCMFLGSADTYSGHLDPKYWSEHKTFNT